MKKEIFCLIKTIQYHNYPKKRNLNAIDAIYYFNDETVSVEDKRKLLDSLNNIFLDIVLEKKGK